MIKIAFNFFLHSKRDLKILKRKWTNKNKRKIANLHNMYVFDSDEKIFDEPKKKIFNQFLGQNYYINDSYGFFLFLFKKRKNYFFTT